MRLIDADAIREKHCDGCNADIKESCKTDPICATLMWIVDEPTIDAVPVVHCQDCKNHTMCLTEDVFMFARIENPFCCAGVKSGGE